MSNCGMKNYRGFVLSLATVMRRREEEAESARRRELLVAEQTAWDRLLIQTAPKADAVPTLLSREGTLTSLIAPPRLSSSVSFLGTEVAGSISAARTALLQLVERAEQRRKGAPSDASYEPDLGVNVCSRMSVQAFKAAQTFREKRRKEAGSVVAKPESKRVRASVQDKPFFAQEPPSSSPSILAHRNILGDELATRIKASEELSRQTIRFEELSKRSDLLSQAERVGDTRMGEPSLNDKRTCAQQIAKALAAQHSDASRTRSATPIRTAVTPLSRSAAIQPRQSVSPHGRVDSPRRLIRTSLYN